MWIILTLNFLGFLRIVLIMDSSMLLLLDSKLASVYEAERLIVIADLEHLLTLWGW